MIRNPLEQFKLISIINIPIPYTITNSGIFLILFISLITIISKDKKSIIPDKFVASKELIYRYIIGIVKENISDRGLKYFPIIVTIFLFIGVQNLISSIPFTYSITSQIIITLGLSFSIWQGIVYESVQKNKLEFLGAFMPEGSPIILAPLLTGIEIISFIARSMSLAIRLAANLTSGHILFNILAWFTWGMLRNNGILILPSIMTILVIIFLIVLELGVAIIQSYVFILLTMTYLNEAH